MRSTTLTRQAGGAWRAPPRDRNPDGAPRRIGVELEFAGLTAADTAAIVQATFGGDLDGESEFRIRVRDTELGDFLVELDWRYLHNADLDAPIRRGLGDIASTVVPMEIACPPIPLGDAPRIDELRERLRAAGAVGTHGSPLYALGVQLNPELPSFEPAYILDMLRAFVLLRDWLRAEIAVDTSRRLLFFAMPFPGDYCDLVLDPAYAPDQARLIDDYIRLNPTRNREVDLLPLFAHLDERRVRAALPQEKINARPTWHYRLPNALIDEADWTIGIEWNRWVAVETLAERGDLLAEHSAAWRRNHAQLIPSDWTPRAAALRARLAAGERP